MTDGSLTGAIIVAILLAGAGFLVYVWWRGRRAPGVGAPTITPPAAHIPTPAELSSPDLDRWATALLIAADERSHAVRSAAELAASGNGHEPSAVFRESLASVDDDLQHAFAVRLRLEAGATNEAAPREALLREIAEHAKRAYETLDAAIGGLGGPHEVLREGPVTPAASPMAESDTEKRVSEELAEADRDLRDIRSGLAELGQLDVGVAGRVREVERILDRAHEAARDHPEDPMSALRLATEAHRIATSTLLVARDADAVHERLVLAADASIRLAAADIDRTTALLATERRAVGDLARAQLTEARRELAAASSTVATDPAAASDAAGRAEGLATASFLAVEADLADRASGGPGWGLPGGTDGDATAEIIQRLLSR